MRVQSWATLSSLPLGSGWPPLWLTTSLVDVVLNTFCYDGSTQHGVGGATREESLPCLSPSPSHPHPMHGPKQC